jgi:hypothetical protein
MDSINNTQKHASVATAPPYTRADLFSFRVEPVMVDPKLARHLRDTCHFERQRNVDPKNVNRLMYEILNRTFIGGTPIFTCVLPDGSMRLVNGNHTLEAIAKANVSVPLTFIYKHVKDLDEVGHIYSVLDLQKTRTWNDAIRATGIGEETPMARLVNVSLVFIASGFKPSKDNPVIRSRAAMLGGLFPEYKETAQLLDKCFAGASGNNKRILLRAPILAVALYTTKHQPSEALKFWRETVMDDGLKIGHPGKALLSYGRNTPAAGTTTVGKSEDGTRERRPNRIGHLRAAALAWNAAYEGREIEKCQPWHMGQFRLLGTPWHDGEPKKRRDDDPVDRPSPPQPPQDDPVMQRPLFETGIAASGSGLSPLTRFRN